MSVRPQDLHPDKAMISLSWSIYRWTVTSLWQLTYIVIREIGFFCYLILMDTCIFVKEKKSLHNHIYTVASTYFNMVFAQVFFFKLITS